MIALLLAAHFALPPAHDLQFNLPAYAARAAVRAVRDGDEHFVYGTRRTPAPVQGPPPSGAKTALCNGSITDATGVSSYMCHVWGVHPDAVVWVEMYDLAGKALIMEDADGHRGAAALRCTDDGSKWICTERPWSLLPPSR